MFLTLIAILSGLLLSLTSASGQGQIVIHQQPEAPFPPQQQRRPLPWGKLNFLSTTDVHGWVEGHIKEPSYSADWGDVYSFVHHMKHKAHAEGRDLLLVDCGDLHDGTGLSDTTPIDGEITDEIFKYLDYDLLSVGNHELYVGAITKQMYEKFVPRYPGRYLTSNVKITINGVSRPMGSLYRKFTTSINHYTILAFGILFDFRENDKLVSTCQPVDELIKESWFQHVLMTETYDVDLIVVVGHTPIRNSTGFEYDLVLSEIRRRLPTMPVQFFGGHSHIRDFRKYDDYAYGIESGRYLETLGWIGVDLEPFHVGRRYIDNNVAGYRFHTGIEEEQQFETKEGQAISHEIELKRKQQGLRKVLGCVPHDFYVNRAPYPSNYSIYSLLNNEVFPKLIYNSSYNEHRLSMAHYTKYVNVVLLNTGGIRFDLLRGNMTLNDEKTVSPFKNAFLVLKDILYGDAKIVLDWLNTGRFGYIVQDEEEEGGYDDTYDIALQYSWERYQSEKHNLSDILATPGYVTYDDFGSDGDDTIHTPLPHYRLPFYVQATLIPDNLPDSDYVDLIFTNFSAPGVITILNSYAPSGRTFDLDELEFYQSDPITLTNMFERYSQVEDAWKLNENGSCTLS